MRLSSPWTPPDHLFLVLRGDPCNHLLNTCYIECYMFPFPYCTPGHKVSPKQDFDLLSPFYR